MGKSENCSHFNTCFFTDDRSCNTYYDIMCITTPRCNQPNGKTHFTEKPSKNVVNTSKNGPFVNLFKITSCWQQTNKHKYHTLCSYQKNITFPVFQVISLGLQGSEPENETMSQLESHEVLFLSGLKICKSWKILVQT